MKSRTVTRFGVTVGIVIWILGLASVFFLADTPWIYASSAMSALGGAVFGASLARNRQ